MPWWKRPFKALQSRKVRVALATVVAAIAAEHGLELSETLVYGIIGVGVAIVLGIAHEDNGRFQRVELEVGELKTLQVRSGPTKN